MAKTKKKELSPDGLRKTFALVRAETGKKVDSSNPAYMAMLQLVVTYLLPEWNSNTGTYAKGSLVRCQGRVFEAKADTSAPPFTPYEDGSGNILVDSHWNVIISERVDTDNWAHLQDTNPLSLFDQINALDNLLKKQNERIAKIEAFLSANTLVIT